MKQIHSFPPIANPDATVLILGSIPGKASLQARQYYAHPRNAFWPIMGNLIDATPCLPYAARIEKLKTSGIALWDVLASCVRDGSLDSGIAEASASANDFNGFFMVHTSIRQVFFNGAMAEKCFKKYVLPYLEIELSRLQRLPSTSPAHASKTYQQKLDAWAAIIEK